MPAMLHGADVVGRPDDPLGVEESSRERAIVARRSHDDRERASMKTHVERLFGRSRVLTGRGAGRAKAHDPNLADGSQRLRRHDGLVISHGYPGSSRRPAARDTPDPSDIRSRRTARDDEAESAGL